MLTKYCGGCGFTRSVDKFSKRSENTKYYRSRCKDCTNSMSSKYGKENKDAINRRIRLDRKKNPLKYREQDLKQSYGLTLKDFNTLLKNQNGKCAICNCSQEAQLSVDHCHISEAVRGLLCSKCNKGIGFLKDSRVNLLSADEYLDNPPAQKKPTKVIDLLAGSGVGKSTLAAGLFYTAKMKQHSCELVTEFAKTFAWEERKIGPMDQSYIFGEQSKRESNLYNKVDTIFTDSPLLLSSVYEEFYHGKSIMFPAIRAFLKSAEELGVTHHYYILSRNKPFDTRGRFETAEQAKEVDAFLFKKMEEWKIPYTLVDCVDVDRVKFVLGDLKLC